MNWRSADGSVLKGSRDSLCHLNEDQVPTLMTATWEHR